jgi:hypothetical protein
VTDLYVYRWGNSPRRAELKGRTCRVLARGRLGSVLVELTDTHERVVTSRRALHGVRPCKEFVNEGRRARSGP